MQDAHHFALSTKPSIPAALNAILHYIRDLLTVPVELVERASHFLSFGLVAASAVRRALLGFC